MTGNRSGSVQHYQAGASKESGKITAMLATCERWGGMGGGSLPTPPYIYDVESRWARVGSVHTAMDSNRAMRAPGHPQASFGMESVVDELAYGVGWDPLEFRIKTRSLSATQRRRPVGRPATTSPVVWYALAWLMSRST